MDPAPPGFWRTVGRGLLLRCPACGRGSLFTGYFSMAAACPACGLDIRREQGYYVGAMYINYGVTAVIELSVGVPLAGRIPMASLLWPLSIFCILFPLWFFRYSRSLWLGMDLYFTALVPR